MKTIRVYDGNDQLLAIEEVSIEWGPMRIKNEMYKKHPNMKYYE